MEDSASMLCARVIRGTSSMAKKDTPVAASSAHSRTAVSGSPNPIETWPGRSSDRSDAAQLGIGAETSHLGDDIRFSQTDRRGWTGELRFLT